MSLFVFKLTVENVPRKRDLPKALKFSWARAGALWHKRFLPQHFTPRGATKYGYGPRAKGYMRRKMAGYKVDGRRIAGHRNPLVWSGKSKELASIRDIRATGARGGHARVVIHARGLNRRNPKTVSPQTMREELLTITGDELQIIVRQFSKDMVSALNRLAKRNRKTTRG